MATLFQREQYVGKVDLPDVCRTSNVIYSVQYVNMVAKACTICKYGC